MSTRQRFIMFAVMLMIAMFVSADEKKEDDKGLVVKTILKSVDKDIQKGFAGRAQAIKKLEQLLTIDNECIEVYYKLATCYYKNSKKKQAIKYYNIVFEKIGGPTRGDLGKMYDDSQEKINELDPVMKQIRKLKQQYINDLLSLRKRYKDKRIDEELALLGVEIELQARLTRLLTGSLGVDSLDEDTPAVPTLNRRINLYGAYSAMLLRLGLHVTESNKAIRSVAEWFDHKHPNNRDLQGEADFSALELARLYVALKDSEVLEPQTKAAIKRFFLEFNFKSMYHSENHDFVFLTARYLMANEFAGDVFKAYGKTGAELYTQDGQNLKWFIRFRARRGWGEFDSGGYQFLVFNTLLTLYDHSKDQELADLAEKMCNLLLADMSVDTLNGLYGGARGRVYEHTVLDPATSILNVIPYLYFGIADPRPESGQTRLLSFERMSYWELMNESLFSSFRPMNIVCDIAMQRNSQYVNLERKHLHNTDDPLPKEPLDGSIRKYTWYMPEKYILGSVQLQDPYPAGLAAGGYAKHQQHEWDFTIASGTKTKQFTHHPGAGGAHLYWSGDCNCKCTRTFQNKTAVLAIFDIPLAQKYQYIHAYLPREEFDEIVEDSGWIFARGGDVFSALYLTGGYRWVTSGEWAGVEVISDGAKKASVFEVGHADTFGSFAGFINAIKKNPVLFDPSSMTLRYTSTQAGTIKINHDELRQVDGVDVDLNYALYDSPYMQSDWDSGVISLMYNGKKVVLNFN